MDKNDSKTELIIYKLVMDKRLTKKEMNVIDNIVEKNG